MSVATGGRHSGCLRTLAFSDPESELWGAAWIPPRLPPVAVLSAGGGADSTSATLEGEDAHEPWRLRVGESEFLLEGLADPVENPAEAQPEFDQLCQVSGTVAVTGQAREVSCLGWRGARSPAILSADVASLRQVAAWFAADDGFALLALRSARAKGQDADTVSAAMFAPDESQAVADPRLSTTYTDSGEPVRAGVELWIHTGDDLEQQYPRRAVGQATHAPARWTVDDLALEARPFYWHAGEREGPGIYVLGRRS